MNLALAMFGEKPRLKAHLDHFSTSLEVDRQFKAGLECF